MKILFINSIDIVGGAAIAAWRIASGLEKHCGTENHFLVATKKSNFANVHQVIPPGKIPRLIDSYMDGFASRLGLQYLWIPFTSRRIFSLASRIRPDVISLHNIHGGFFPMPLLSRLSEIAPIVWTLHDMWGFTRNAAYTNGNYAWMRMRSFEGEKDLYPEIGLDTGSLLLHFKKHVYAKSRLVIVSPSRWLCSLAKAAPLFEGKDKFHIPNGIDTELFRPIGKAEARTRLGIPPEGRYFIFDTSWIHSVPRKGGKSLIEILQQVNAGATGTVKCLVLGSELPAELRDLPRLEFHIRGYVDTEADMAVYYNAADLLIFPSQDDNLPNVLVESICCGTPCVAFEVGGVRDIIHDGVSGYCLPPFNTKAFAAKVLDLMEGGPGVANLFESSRAFAVSQFDSHRISEMYLELFQAAAAGRTAS
ncbi:MAG: glycosyltransferase [Desulfobacteraceae bacterium]|nr:glycosyltransferase [Desulfobacteraceae bacterium]